jgi:glutathione S-transferase
VAAIELYACMTPNVLKVMLMLGELELPFRIRHVRIYRGEQFDEGFETLHPYRKLPVLIDHEGPAGAHTAYSSQAPSRLRESRYLAGEELTMADIATFPWLWRHPTMLGIDEKAFPHIQRWVGEIRARTGFRSVHGRYKQLVEIDLADAIEASPDMKDRILGRGRWSLAD